VGIELKNRINSWIAVCLATVVAPLNPFLSVSSASAVEGIEAVPLPTISIESTPIAGAAIDADKVPGNVQSVTAADITRRGPASLTRALDAELGSVSIGENLDDPFQPDILYRGFEASPVLGTPQGLAVYQNGVRINEAFGDTVNWDLLPDFAIQRVDIVSSSPVYGLNALGGAISISMKDGFSYRGNELEVYGGSFGQRAAVLQYAVRDSDNALYLAGRALGVDGWREFSADSVRQLYAVFSRRSGPVSLNLSYTYVENQLGGQGSAPMQEIAVDRSLVFTGPQGNSNRLSFVTLNSSYRLSDHWAMQGVLYYRQHKQDVANGNTTAFSTCNALPGFLCQPDGTTPVTNQTGQPLPDISKGGSVPIGENDSETINAYARGVALQARNDHAIFDRANSFTAGATFDYAQINFFSSVQIGIIDPQLQVLPSDLIVGTPETSSFGPSPVSLKASNQVFGAYLTDTFDLASALSLTLSARYNSARINLHDQTGSVLTGDNRFDHFNPGVGVTYELLPVLTMYAGYSENTRTPTASEIECSDPLRPCLLPSSLASDPPKLRQVTAHTFELGLRGRLLDLAGRNTQSDLGMSWNLSLFRVEVDHDIYGIATSVNSGYFQNIGATRRLGLEAGFKYRGPRWSAFLDYSLVEATFQSALLLPSPSNPLRDGMGNIQVIPGDRLPGIPQHRLKAGAEFALAPEWNFGAALRIVSDQFYFADESNQNRALPGFWVIDIHTSYQFNAHFEAFGTIDNLFNRKYSTFGIYGDPTGVRAPGVPPDAIPNGPGVDNRFQSPAAPFAFVVGLRISL
jgi:iron complex outermembrane receptor protein